ncbi:hypothetical protein [Microbacterium profundi]|uniref:hypothetical protein n=1 Tax=Microbacterium profundi TaxID=450380 RepID=UPI001363ADDD|nr:hypothetical protein [Microbacterium profundi]
MATTPKTNTTPLDPLVVADDAEDAASRVTIPHAEQATVFARPDGIGHLWVEDEYDELQEEQHHLWSASADNTSRKVAIEAAKLRTTAAEAEALIAANRAVVDAARERAVRTTNVLAPFRRRAKGAKLWYQAGKAGLLCGDVAGFGTAAIWLGELPAIAIALASSAAIATIAAGLIGVDVRDREQRRQRQLAVPDPSQAQQEFPHLFIEPSGGVLRRMLMLAVVTASMIGVGIAALRSAVDDPFVGIVFGGIALAVAGGSFLVSYAGADEVADLLDHADADYNQTAQKHLTLSGHPALRSAAGAEAEAESITLEHSARGEAAERRVRSLKWGILRRNPSHAGHGPATARIGGQTPRREDTRS